MTTTRPATAEEIDARHAIKLFARNFGKRLWVARCLHNLQTRVPDPVEDEERAAHFETHKRKGSKK